MSDADRERVTELLAALNNEQRAALGDLSDVLDQYYDDYKVFMNRSVRSVFASTEDEDEAVLAIVLSAGNMLLRGLAKFMLATGEIVAFGVPQGDVSMETTRILEVPDINFD